MIEQSNKIYFGEGHLANVKGLLDESQNSIGTEILLNRAEKQNQLELVIDTLKNELTNNFFLIEGLELFLPTLESLTSPVSLETVAAAQEIINIYNDIMLRGPNNVKEILIFLKRVKEINLSVIHEGMNSLITPRMVEDMKVIVQQAEKLDAVLHQHGEEYVRSYKVSREKMKAFFESLG